MKSQQSSSVDELKQLASDRCGLTDFGDPHHETAVAAWVADLAHPRLSERGRSFFSRQMILDLERRLRVLDELRRHPEIAEVELPRIVHVSGLERSGTTLLHNLLTLPDGHRALRRWELMHPLPPPEAATYFTDPRIAATQASIEPLRGTMLERMHWVEAQDPEECQWALLDGSSILAGAAGASMPTWMEWTRERDPTVALKEYRQVVQLLLWRNPVPDGGVLVLKAPQFLPYLRQLRSVFPEMQTVLTHRDPYRCLVSTVTMLRSINESFLDDRGVLDALPEVMITRAVHSLRGVTDLDLDGVAHAAYPQLVADPVGVVLLIHDALGLAAPEDLSVRVERFLADQRAGRRAAPPTELPSHTFDQDQLRAIPEVRQYCDLYGVEPERVRLTG
jgi:hypothetical protein